MSASSGAMPGTRVQNTRYLQSCTGLSCEPYDRYQCSDTKSWVDCAGAVKKSPQLIAQLGSEQEPSPRTEPRLAEGGAVARGSTVVLSNWTFDLKSEKMLMAQICISK